MDSSNCRLLRTGARSTPDVQAHITIKALARMGRELRSRGTTQIPCLRQINRRRNKLIRASLAEGSPLTPGPRHPLASTALHQCPQPTLGDEFSGTIFPGVPIPAPSTPGSLQSAAATYLSHHRRFDMSINIAMAPWTVKLDRRPVRTIRMSPVRFAPSDGCPVSPAAAHDPLRPGERDGI